MAWRSVCLSLASLAFWGAATYYGVVVGPKFFDYTSTAIQSPPGSPSLLAEHKRWTLFSQKTAEYPFPHGVLVVARDPEHSIWSPAVEHLTQLVINSTLGACASDVSIHNAVDEGNLCWWRKANGLFVDLFLERDAADLDLRMSDFVSPDNATATIILIHVNSNFGGAGNPPQQAAWARLQRALDGWRKTHGEYYTVGSTHEQMVLNAAQSHIIADFTHGDMITLPIAWLLLLCSCAG